MNPGSNKFPKLLALLALAAFPLSLTARDHNQIPNTGVEDFHHQAPQMQFMVTLEHPYWTSHRNARTVRITNTGSSLLRAVTRFTPGFQTQTKIIIAPGTTGTVTAPAGQLINRTTINVVNSISGGQGTISFLN